MRQFVIINGCGACGKDTFVTLCQVLGEPGIKVYNYSTIAAAKTLTGIIGRYVGGMEYNRQVENKTDRYRSALSEVKKFLDDHYDASVNDLDGFITMIDANNTHDDYCVFIHCREPKNIDELIRYFGRTCYTDMECSNVHTLLITGRTTPEQYMNTSDREVYEYDYDTVISNCGTYDSLKEKAVTYMEEVLHYKVNTHQTNE